MENRRYEQSMQGLLRFAVEHTKSEDAPNVSALQEMNEDRKNFLEEAFSSMAVDIKEEFRKAIAILINDKISAGQKLEALNTIRDLIENTDFANSFAKIDGTLVLKDLLQHENHDVRIATANIIAEMSQNNTFCQKHFKEIEILPSLLVAVDDTNKNVASSSLHAISSLIRGYEPGLVEFIKLKGLEKLVVCLKIDYQKIFMKACFLIATLSAENSYVRDKFVRCDVISVLSKYIEPVFGYDVKLDSVLFALAELTKSPMHKITPQVRLTLYKSIEEFMRRCKDLPECEEMISNANSTIMHLKKNESNQK